MINQISRCRYIQFGYGYERQKTVHVQVGLAGSKERVTFDGVFGSDVDDAGADVDTNVGIIHYGSDGVHIVPARPPQ